MCHVQQIGKEQLLHFARLTKHESVAISDSTNTLFKNKKIKIHTNSTQPFYCLPLVSRRMRVRWWRWLSKQTDVPKHTTSFHEADLFALFHGNAHAPEHVSACAGFEQSTRDHLFGLADRLFCLLLVVGLRWCSGEDLSAVTDCGLADRLFCLLLVVGLRWCSGDDLFAVTDCEGATEKLMWSSTR